MPVQTVLDRTRKPEPTRPGAVRARIAFVGVQPDQPGSDVPAVRAGYPADPRRHRQGERDIPRRRRVAAGRPGHPGAGRGLRPRGEPEADRVVVGHDMRDTSPELVEAFTAGATAAGLDVVRIGLCSTDALYYASGAMRAPGAMFTASHSPARVERDQAVCAPRCPPGRAGQLAWPRSATRRVALLLDQAWPDVAVRPEGVRRRPRRVGWLRDPPALAGGPDRAATAAHGRRRGQRDGGAHGAGRARCVRGAAPAGHRRRAAVLRAGRQLPQPRGEPTRPEEPARPAGRGAGARRGPSGWRSTGTPTVASSSTRRAPRSARARSRRSSPPGRSPRSGPQGGRPR